MTFVSKIQKLPCKMTYSLDSNYFNDFIAFCTHFYEVHVLFDNL